MRVAIRADASASLGTGHVTRCLTLADALAAKGAKCVFLSRELPAHLEAAICARGHGAIRLASDAPAEAREALKDPVDWLIVDHYGLDARWESAARPAARRLLAVDDLADRPHDCDALLDSAYGEDGSRYHGLLPKGCLGLFGSAYLPLRPQFASARGKIPPSLNLAAPVAHVFFGGSDRNRHTTRFARVIATRLPRLRQEIAVGALYPDMEGLDRLKKEFPGGVAYRREVEDMAAHMSLCSVALGAPGMATWERACLGLPGAYVATHSNQIPILAALEKKGFCRFLGEAGAITDDAFAAGVGAFLDDAGGLASMRKMGLAAIDGKGTGRIVDALSSYGDEKRA